MKISPFDAECSISIDPKSPAAWLDLDLKPGPDGLVPAIVQDAATGAVLMLGYLNADAWAVTVSTGNVTFFSRSKQRLWTKGETSGNFLQLRAAAFDCDRDALLFKVQPIGPVCHTGKDTCWGEQNQHPSFVHHLEGIVQERKLHPKEGAYTNVLFNKGIPKIAQKVGEEAVETVIEAMRDKDDLFKGEVADLLYHLVVLLAAKGFTLADIEAVLRERHQ
jgi:phosphoribosyl-AMP cyclohydrolase / phosphoribosyl-ATP pyrophosphohydrolase